ncbi:hypothetical protein QTO34_016544 [Cnephaeus nilssonii]|uniref:Uncharacterized protein n=1 Tax=Cnephaeus nilssonii TaxID=3371016 RepID=A0AA40I2K2_CNENI|nr:hypothetical protein QTO34_016544 [Eptesicus nilssonii]
MNDFSSGDKPEDNSGNPYAYHPRPPPPQSCSAGCWHSANPDDMVVDYEAHAAADVGENMALSPPCVEDLDHQKPPGDFSGPAHAVVTAEPSYPRSSCHSRQSPQGQSDEPSPPFARKPKEGDWSCADCPDAWELNQTFDMRVDNAHCTFAKHHAVGKSQSLHASGSLQPTGMRSGNTSLSCSVRPASHSEKTHVTETSYDRGVFQCPAATASEAQGAAFTAFSEVLMQTDAFVPDVGNACPYSSGKVTTFDNSTAPVLRPEPNVTGAEHTQMAPHEEDLEIQHHTIELVPSSPPGHSLELTWDENDMVISANDAICMSTPVPRPLNATFFVSPVEATEKCNNLEKSHRELSKPNLGKPTTKANTPIGSKVRKNKIISYPRPNFKNVKAKVMSRPASQAHDPALSKVTPRPQLTSACSSPSSVSSSRQLTALSKTRRSDLNADTKAETPISKTQKQQLNKLITSQAEHVATHSKNASHKVSRTTPALKSNREDVDKASSSHSACEPGSVASFLQKCRGLFSVTMESPECLEMTYVPNIRRTGPEEKGEQENGTLLEKQDLKKDVLNETFDYGSLFLGSASKTAAPAGRNAPKPDASSLRITPGPKAKVGPSASCLRCTSNSRTLSSDRTLSLQRIRRAASSDEETVTEKLNSLSRLCR